MKKLLAVILCVCIALTISVSAMAESSPKNRVIGRNAIISKYDGTSVAEDTWTELSAGGEVTVKANEKTYGKFNNWKIYKVVVDASGKETYTEAVEGVDYQIVSGSATSDTMTIKPLGESTIAVVGNYNGKIADPSKASSTNATSKSPKNGDVNAMAAVIVLLAAGAVVFGAKRQLSK